jgi:MFS family permease
MSPSSADLFRSSQNIGTMTRTLYEYNKRHTNSLFELFTLDADAFKQGDVQQLQAHQVSAISVGNALGRIFIGLLSDLVVNRTGKSANRVYLLLLVSFLALASQGLAATPDTITDLKKLLTFSSTTGLMYGTL